MVQIGTTLHKEGPEAFKRITEELKAIMEEKGIKLLKTLEENLNIC